MHTIQMPQRWKEKSGQVKRRYETKTIQQEAFSLLSFMAFGQKALFTQQSFLSFFSLFLFPFFYPQTFSTSGFQL